MNYTLKSNSVIFKKKKNPNIFISTQNKILSEIKKIFLIFVSEKYKVSLQFLFGKKDLKKNRMSYLHLSLFFRLMSFL